MLYLEFRNVPAINESNAILTEGHFQNVTICDDGRDEATHAAHSRTGSFCTERLRYFSTVPTKVDAYVFRQYQPYYNDCCQYTIKNR